MNCDNAIIVAVIGGGFVLASPVVGYFIFKRRERHRAGVLAKGQAVEAFMPEIILLTPATDDVGKNINWYNYLIKMVVRHQAAIFKVEPFLKESMREALRAEWDTYNGNIQSIPGWINEACMAHLERARWGNTPKCPYCGSENTNPLKNELRHHCNGCRTSFSVTVGTIFHRTHLPLQKWFLAISLIMNANASTPGPKLAKRSSTAQSIDYCECRRGTKCTG